MSEIEILNEAEIKSKMQSSIDAFRKELTGLRAGRASPALVETIAVDVYGAKMPISQLATVSNLDGQTLQISVWDQEVVKSIEKAIANSSLGVTPNTEGNVIRISLPSLSEERRNELSKLATKYAENYRITIRATRRIHIDLIKASEKDSNISKDEAFKLQDKVEQITKDYINNIDELLATKIKDIQLD